MEEVKREVEPDPEPVFVPAPIPDGALLSHRHPDESYENYRKRIALNNKALRYRLRWIRKTSPKDNKTGEPRIGNRHFYRKERYTPKPRMKHKSRWSDARMAGMLAELMQKWSLLIKRMTEVGNGK